MNKRSTKFYRKNESEVMKRIGLKPTKNSGAGWIEKCDGQNEQYICELKSTDRDSFSIKQSVLHTLEYHASVAHKTPLFAFQFLNTNEVWVTIKEDEFRAYMDFKEQQKKEKENYNDDNLELDESDQTSYNVIVQSRNAGKTYLARQMYNEQKEKERKQKDEEYKNKMRERRNKTDWKRNLNKRE